MAKKSKADSKPQRTKATPTPGSKENPVAVRTEKHAKQTKKAGRRGK